MRSFFCTNCGANLTIQEDNRDFSFCQYCGTKIMLDDYRSTHRVVDEAKIVQAEADKIVKLKKIELLEKKQLEKKRIRKMKIIASLCLAALALISFLLCFSSLDLYIFFLIGFIALISIIFIWGPEIKGENTQDKDLLILNDWVKVPSGIAQCQNMNFNMVVKMFEDAGFLNIQVVPMGDLVLGLTNPYGGVDRILINNEMVTQGGGIYSPGARVVIYYHSNMF